MFCLYLNYMNSASGCGCGFFRKIPCSLIPDRVQTDICDRCVGIPTLMRLIHPFQADGMKIRVKEIFLFLQKGTMRVETGGLGPNFATRHRLITCFADGKSAVAPFLSGPASGPASLEAGPFSHWRRNNSHGTLQ
jgi:hypothetical protein